MTATYRLNNLRQFNLGLLHNNDSLTWSCWNIDVVNACSCATDDFKIFSSLDHFCIHLCSWSNNQTIIVLRQKRSVQWKPKIKLNRLTTVHVDLPSLTAISARSSSLVSFVFKSTAMPFASRIVLQQLSTLSLINTRLRSNENAILFLSLSIAGSIDRRMKFPRVHTLRISSHSYGMWLVEKNRHHVQEFSRHYLKKNEIRCFTVEQF